MAPSITPNRTGVRVRVRCRIHARYRINARCRIDRIFLNHHRRRRYDDRPANHDRGSRLLDNDGRRSPVRRSFPLIAWNFAIRNYREIGGHCRRGKS